MFAFNDLIFLDLSGNSILNTFLLMGIRIKKSVTSSDGCFIKSV